jgi:hypothetical protein
MASELRVNTLKDASGNNSVATSTVAQGSAKAWLAAETDAQPFDSFNTASGQDNGTGDYTYAFTNVMSNDDYSITACASYAAILAFDNPERTTSNYNVRIFARTDSLTNDNAKNNQAIHGDLA